MGIACDLFKCNHNTGAGFCGAEDISISAAAQGFPECETVETMTVEANGCDFQAHEDAVKMGAAEFTEAVKNAAMKDFLKKSYE